MSTIQAGPERDVRSFLGPDAIKSLIKSNLREYGMLIALIAIMAFFQVVTKGTLLMPVNLTNLVLQNSYIVIMALGMLLIIVSGAIDLSVGSVVGFIGAISAILMVNYNMNFLLVMLICLIAGGLIGAWNGLWVAYVKIPAFIATLAGMLIFRGLTLTILNGESIGPFPVGFQRLSSGFIPDLFGGQGIHITTLVIGALLSAFLVYRDLSSRRKQLKYKLEVSPMVFFVLKNVLVTAAIMGLCWLMATYKGLPNVLVVMMILIGVYGFLTTSTVIGRRIYAMGGNEKAAQLSGVKTVRLLFMTFVNMGLLSALAGMVFAARLNSATPKAGNGFELDVIAACFIGGASSSGGIGTVIGAVIGALVMGVLNNGMSIMGVGIDVQQAIKGLVLLAAVFFDVYSKRKG